MSMFGRRTSNGCPTSNVSSITHNMTLLEKLRNLPAWQRKIILWTILFFFGLGLLFFNLKNFQKKLDALKKRETYVQRFV